MTKSEPKPRIQTVPDDQTTPKSDINPVTTNKFAYGLDGLCSIIKCTRPTAAKLIKSGSISYIKAGGKYIFDPEQVLSELSHKKTV